MKCIVIGKDNRIVNTIEAEEDYLALHEEARKISEEESSIYSIGQVYVGAIFDPIRSRRAKELEAFDIYKANVAYGIETETPEKKAELVKWYQNWLDFPETITADNYQSVVYPEIPAEVKKYMNLKEDENNGESVEYR